RHGTPGGRRGLRQLMVGRRARKPSEGPASAQAVVEEFRSLEARRLRPGWRRAVVGAAAALAAVTTAAVLLIVWPMLWPPAKERGQAVPLKGSLDLRVTEAGNPLRQKLFLHQPGALPLKARDLMEIKAEVNRPAYLYLVYLDSEGKATPLFPWKEYDWKQRPAEKQRLQLFQQGPLDAGPSGIEALLLLVREEPLPEDADLPKQ